MMEHRLIILMPFLFLAIGTIIINIMFFIRIRKLNKKE
jgi:hypothetical protein